MKNIFKTAIVAIALVMTAVTAQAQVKGDMAAGAKVAFAIGNGATYVGIGAKYQYNVMDPLRLEGSFTYFLPKTESALGVKSKTGMWDFMVNAHWLFRVSDRINLYPVAGLGVMGVTAKAKADLGELGDYSVGGNHTDFAFNLGGGADFFLSDSFFINVEAKYMFANGGCFMPSAGVGFMF